MFEMGTKTKGVLAIFGASFMWALEPIFAKLAYRGSDFLQTSAILAISVAAIAFVYVLVTNKADFRVNRKQFSVLVYIALAGTVFADLLYLFALGKIPVINAVLIAHLQPIFVVLMGYFVLREDKLGSYDYLGVAVMIAAGLLVTTKTWANFAAMRFGTTGDLIVLLAVVAWSTTGIAMRKYLRELNAGVITFYRFSMAAVVLVGYVSSTGGLVLSNVYQVLVGMVAGVGMILYYESLKRIKAAQVSALELSTLFFATVLGFLVLGESATIMQILGMVFMFVGVYFLSGKAGQE